MLPHLTPQRQAHIYSTGLLTIITLGTLALIATCFVAMWALVELATLVFIAIFEACTLIGQLYSAADPLVKVLIWVILGTVLYRLARLGWRV
ncbi:MAG: hypothetical protein ACRDHZ_06005 [Ktedonobacteraceae bacterium]